MPLPLFFASYGSDLLLRRRSQGQKGQAPTIVCSKNHIFPSPSFTPTSSVSFRFFNSSPINRQTHHL
ncbi:hypothetical protein I7I53_05401 [Histoplasma capsulatum var. duboisii H88]|uniref:Uncharacterized protein n=1 Tax=Ajellomyces capsulatus (strain H88) TaxID=544711 RepID=A0A8A1LUS4_AJEC8|nr:hypothetical protein I7I53_05401 [Histoplasma capsulatum var. duboisii H88]